jgi:hypothetical protein
MKAGGKQLVNAQNSQNIVSIILQLFLFHLSVKCSKVKYGFHRKLAGPTSEIPA